MELNQKKKTINVLKQVRERIKQHGRYQSITQLCLDQIHIRQFQPQLNHQIQNCKSLMHLSLSSCQLINLQNFPTVKKLKYLDLQENKFQQKQIFELLKQFERLDGINLSRNKVQNIENLINVINKLQIKQINVFQTPLILNQPSKILQQLFTKCKSLQCINWEDKKGKQVKQLGQQSQESSESSDERQQSQNNQKSYSEDQEMENQVSMQSSKKIKVQ